MKVWACTVCGASILNTLLGIFSSRDKAETQAHVFMQGIGELFEEIDRDTTEYNTTIYYQTVHGQEGYTATIEEYELDELSY